MKRTLENWRKQAKALKTEVYALYLAFRDPRAPWYARLCAACIVAYLLSPIDLIPDFIPVIGCLDDLILLPIAIAVVLKMIPPEVLAQCRSKAQQASGQFKIAGWMAALFILSIWVSFTVWAIKAFVR
jgi:uncharacterized membrane protein YkvA (DUF1232 family)